MAHDHQYLDGVYYDVMTGDYCRVVELEDTFGLVEPDRPNSDPFFTFDEEGYEKEDALGQMDTDFREVPEDAIDDPSGFIVEILDLVASGESISYNAQIGLRYARQQVNIIEAE